MTQTNGVYINKIKSISLDNLNPTNSGFINASDRAVCLIRLAAMIIMTIVIMLFVGSFIMRSICIENSMVTMTSILVEAAEIALKISWRLLIYLPKIVDKLLVDAGVLRLLIAVTLASEKAKNRRMKERIVIRKRVKVYTFMHSI